MHRQLVFAECRRGARQQPLLNLSRQGQVTLHLGCSEPVFHVSGPLDSERREAGKHFRQRFVRVIEMPALRVQELHHADGFLFDPDQGYREESL